MRFYNPFKPHIVELKIEGEILFAIRKFTSLGWGYLDIEGFNKKNPYYFISPNCVLRYCVSDWFDILEKFSKLKRRKNFDFSKKETTLKQAKFILQ